MKGVGLSVNGVIYGGWKTVSIKQSLKTISGSFSLSVVNRWPGQGQPWGILPGDECVITIDDDVVITGYVDKISPALSPTERSITISGRDQTCDFVDSSAADRRYTNISLAKLASILAQPFGIPVKMLGSSGANFLIFEVSTGETAHAALERACRLRGYLLTTDGMGSIVIKRPIGTPTTSAIEEGVNLKSGRANYDYAERFSLYSVKGQQSMLAQDIKGSDAYRISGSASDPEIERYRYHLTSAEAILTSAESGIRAQWEATTRAAKSASYQVVVQGWRQANGDLWKPDTTVRFKSPFLGANQTLLITEVSFSLDDGGGSVTELTLERPDAYKIDPTIKEKASPLEADLVKDGLRK